jgi:beta-glucosidase
MPRFPVALALALGAALFGVAPACGTDGPVAVVPSDCGDGGCRGPGTDPVEGRVADLLSQMTLEEKIEQMHGVAVPENQGLNFTPDNGRLGIPGFRMVDGMRGVSVFTGVATTFPVGSARGATFDPALEERIGRAIAQEARAKGGNVLLAPTINILRHPRWGRAQETYGEDSFHIGAMAASFVRGVQTSVIANPKHFAANSIEDTRFTVDVQVDERTLREVYLPHFKKVVESGAASIMTAYNKVNGFYSAENAHLLSDILKGEWGFDGFVESDWILGTRSTAPSALAGLDIEMPTANYYGPALLDAVNAGEVPESTIDDAVRRILRAKIRFGIVDGLPVVDPAVVESAEHTALALTAAEEALVLLKNDGASLPIDRTTARTIAVVGALSDTANIGDLGSSATKSSYVVTPFGGISARAGGITVMHQPRNVLTAADLVAIDGVDAAVVVVGLTSADEGEGFIGAGDRKGLVLSAEQERLIADVAAHSARTIVVLEGSGAIVMDRWVNQVEAVLMAWYPGLEGGNAIANVVFGEVNPSGKLPVTFPESESQLPPFVNDVDAVTYEHFHGYRHVDHEGLTPLFPFGFGLSYTTFAVSNLDLDAQRIAPDGTLQVTADVTNTGGASGDEVVQLYVSCAGTAVPRAPRDLKGFSRVHLAPSETKAVSFSVAARDLAYYDVGAGAWKVEPATYTVWVGSDSRSLPLQMDFEIQ